MATPYHHNIIIILFFFFFFHFHLFFFFISGHSFLTRGSSLSVENNAHILRSPNALFTVGFHLVGDNAYCFSVWFSNQPTTIVWMPNRDSPVNGKRSQLSLTQGGNLVLKDADQYIIWSTQTESTSSSLQLKLRNTGNLVLHENGQQQPLWQSFDYPTDTLLPNQPLTKTTQLVSSRSLTNYSSGFYKFSFDDDSILRIHYDGPVASTVFWPDPGLLSWQARRYQFIYNRRASFDSNGQFFSSDGLGFLSADFGFGPQRMMKIDGDGNVRVYSLVEDGEERRKKWEVQWQAVSHPCKIHGVCGPNSLCTYDQDSEARRSCSCLHGYKMVNSQDWSYGCEPDFKICGSPEDDDFIELRHVEFYGFDILYLENYTLDSCKRVCLQNCSCKGFQFGSINEVGTYYCYMKTFLYNGYQMGFYNSMYLRLPKRLVSSFRRKYVKNENSSFRCSGSMVTPIIRSYEMKHENKLLRFMLVFGCVIGFLEFVGIVFFWYKSRSNLVSIEQSYFPQATGFRKFTYNELKRATRNFSEEIGRGGASVVYKGQLSDNRIAAIKRLKTANDRGEAEFKAEISTIGRLNHMNLIETWGYCAEGKHRLVVYEFMENGSLAEKLRTDELDWETRFDIAKGTAKGLAYLHEECLEWVLHCDVKPHNILLDGDNNPKVADFGLSKLFDRSGIEKLNFSTVRGTRGYMAPEWVFNLPITSKVDVFSYGVVILEMVTGNGPMRKKQTSDKNGEIKHELVDWVRDRIREFDASRTGSWIEEIVDPSINSEYDRTMMENLVRIALQCVEEDMEARPSMSQVVNMLLHPDMD